MSLSLDEPPVVVGSQTPTLLVRPEPWSTALAVDAAELAAVCGLVLDDAQFLELEVLLAQDRRGMWASSADGLCKPRQNGKNGTAQAFELATTALLKRRTIHTAHEFKAAIEHFNRMVAMVGESDEVSRLVKRIRTSHGDESIEFLNGSELRFLARTGGSGRSFSAPVIVFDEAMVLSSGALAALVPTMSAQRDSKAVSVGSAGLSTSDYWWGLRKRALAAGNGGSDGRFGWVEWGVLPGERYEGGGPALTNALVARNNSAVGTRISWEAIDTERVLLTPQAFARERLGVWDELPSDVGGAVDAALWAEAQSPSHQPGPGLVFCWDVSPLREAASIGVVSTVGDAVHAEVIDVRPGAGWVAGRLGELVGRHGARGVVCPPGEAASMVPEVDAATPAGVPVHASKGTDLAAACSEFVGLLAGRRLKVVPGPHGAALDAAVAGAQIRPAGDGWRWARPGPDVDLSPLSALTAGLAGLRMDLTPVKVFSVG